MKSLEKLGVENQLLVCLVYLRKCTVLQDFVIAYSQSHNSAEDKNYKYCKEDFLLNLGLTFLRTSKMFAILCDKSQSMVNSVGHCC